MTVNMSLVIHVKSACACTCSTNHARTLSAVPIPNHLCLWGFADITQPFDELVTRLQFMLSSTHTSMHTANDAFAVVLTTRSATMQV